MKAFCSLGRWATCVQLAALGKLTEYFSKLSDNPPLIAALNVFRKERNLLAHAALAVCLAPDGELAYGMVEKLSGRVIAAKAEAKRITDAVH